jgi:hypothetical protein
MIYYILKCIFHILYNFDGNIELRNFSTEFHLHYNGRQPSMVSTLSIYIKYLRKRTLVFQRGMVHDCTPSGWEAEAGRSWVWGQPELCSDFEDSVGYIVRLCLKKQNTQPNPTQTKPKQKPNKTEHDKKKKPNQITHPNIELLYNPAFLLLDIVPRELKTHGDTKVMYKTVHSSIICYSQK